MRFRVRFRARLWSAVQRGSDAIYNNLEMSWTQKKRARRYPARTRLAAVNLGLSNFNQFIFAQMKLGFQNVQFFHHAGIFQFRHGQHGRS